jgi:hypothetical protein
MSSRIRILLKHYPEKQDRYDVYKGGDAIRYLETMSGYKVGHPLLVGRLKDVLRMAQQHKLQLNGLIELSVWRVRRNSKRVKYAAEMDIGRRLFRWPGTGKAESTKLPEKKGEKKVGVQYKVAYHWKRPVDRINRPAHPRVVVREDLADVHMDEDLFREPRDR